MFSRNSGLYRQICPWSARVLSGQGRFFPFPIREDVNALLGTCVANIAGIVGDCRPVSHPPAFSLVMPLPLKTTSFALLWQGWILEEVQPDYVYCVLNGIPHKYSYSWRQRMYNVYEVYTWDDVDYRKVASLKKNQMLLYIAIYSIKSIEKMQRNLILYVIAFYRMLSIIR